MASCFKLAPSGTYTVLHAFAGGNDGAFPFAALEHDRDGNLYGTTEKGGPKDAGTIFKIAADGAFTQLYAFTGGVDGKLPEAHLLKAGDALYGTTFFGGSGQGSGTAPSSNCLRMAPLRCCILLPTQMAPAPMRD